MTAGCAGRREPAGAPVPTAAVPDSARPAPRPQPAARKERKDPPWRPYEDVIRNAEIRRGLFTAYLKPDAVLLGIMPAQLERDYLLVTQLSQGVGEWGLDGGTSLRSDLVRFRRAGDRIELVVVNPYLTAAPGSPAARSVRGTLAQSVAHAFPIATVNEESGQILIDATPFLLSDWGDLSTAFQRIATTRRIGAHATLDRERSSVQRVAIFPENAELEVRLTYQTRADLRLEAVPDYRWIPLGVHYSLLRLPDTPMRPRHADDRVGYFVSAMKDFSRDTADRFFVRYINRWRLEKRDPTLALSPPVRPITFYLDPSIPTEWRPYVRAGILEWNRAFEDAGFRDAIQVLDAPADSLWSPEDARYSTVRWIATTGPAYAIGPTDVDPRTGEVLNADVLISAAWIQSWRGEFGHYVSPEALVREVFAEDSLLRAEPRAARLRCLAAAGLARQGTLVRAVLAARGIVRAGEPTPREYIGQALKELVMHEIGHTLGLRHNFRGTAIIPPELLADRDYTATHGTTGSVMDYNPPAIAPDPARQGDFYSGTVGSYDRWAIRYGYTEFPESRDSTAAAPGGDGSERVPPSPADRELPSLRAIAALASEPGHLYGSDEDAGFGGLGVDPTINRYDQTSDPLVWARGQVRVVNGLLDSLEARTVAPGESYARLRSAFADLLYQRWYAVLVTTKYLAGAITARDHRGDPGARPAFTNVSIDRQREALAFIAEAGFGERAFQFPPDLLRRLAPDRWLHWGAEPFAERRIDFPLHDWAMSLQGALLNTLTDPVVLARIRDAELRAAPGETIVGIPELFTTLAEAIWAETELGAGAAGAKVTGAKVAGAKPPIPRPIASVRRDLQRQHLAGLIRLLVSPAPGTPEDARTVARATLERLAAHLDRVLANRDAKLDAYTSAHLIDSRRRIHQALEAQVVLPAGSMR
ncbi:MAG TPA: zinc-dependent metalloprotease [Gemmatimonadales bacterium]|nr:zinc-dependent metalloprotease [Gemmatimonadales bacterium]